VYIPALPGVRLSLGPKRYRISLRLSGTDVSNLEFAPTGENLLIVISSYVKPPRSAARLQVNCAFIAAVFGTKIMWRVIQQHVAGDAGNLSAQLQVVEFPCLR
jgi:hypothetical protein